MNTCPICLNEIVGEICGFHSRNSEVATWATFNKIMNDLLMRGIEPPRIEKGLEEE